MRVLALIPSLNAADTLGGVIRGVLEHLSDVLVVDDGSSDDTSGVAKAAGVLAIRHEKNLGKGDSLKTGFAYAIENGYDAVLTLDADGQHDPKYIPELLDAAGAGQAITLGCRIMDKDKFPPARYHANQVGIAFLSWRAGVHIDDSQTGYRVYRTDFLKSIRIVSSRFEAESELLIRAGRAGLGIVCVPIEPVYTEELVKSSHYRPVRDTTRICIVFLRSFFWPKR